MNNREITFTVAEEDVRAISVSVINLILQRFGATYQQNLVKVNEAMINKTEYRYFGQPARIDR